MTRGWITRGGFAGEVSSVRWVRPETVRRRSRWPGPGIKLLMVCGAPISDGPRIRRLLLPLDAARCSTSATAARTCCSCASRDRRARRLGRVRGGAAGEHRQPGLPDVAQRLQAGRGVGASGSGSTTSPTSSRIGDLVRANSLDLLQADHTLSGIDMALWDLLGRRLGEPVYRLLGYETGVPEDAVRVAAVRRHAAADAGRRPREPRGAGSAR